MDEYGHWFDLMWRSE